MKNCLRPHALCLVTLMAPVGVIAAPGTPALADNPEPVRLELDAREAGRGLLHARLSIPATGRTLTVAYPKWIPGEHAPSGPLTQVVKLVFQAGGKQLAWQRDDADMYVFHVEVPPGTQRVEAQMDFACLLGEGGFRSEICSSYDQVVVNWWHVVLYPVDRPNAKDPFAASILLPPGWKYASALPVAQVAADGTVGFRTVALDTLIDSPLIAGEHLKTYPLGGARQAQLNVSAEEPRALEIPPAVLSHFRRLVAESEKLFDGPRYAHYNLLLSLGDSIAHYTLEHRESSENRLPTLGLIDPSLLRTSASMIPHEYVHAWNGKHRTPRGLDIRTYQDTMRAELIWVYEGLTDYLSNILTVRSGFWSKEDLLQSLAFDADQMSYHTGRRWRSLQDTSTGVQTVFAAEAWSSARRNADFYPEGGLLWLEVDTLIREHSGGRRSLDDFCKLFFGAASRAVPYGFEDLVAALNEVEPFDWSVFLRQRLDSLSPAPPLQGVEHSGWKLQYSAERPSMTDDMQAAHKTDLLWPIWSASRFEDLRPSIGLLFDESGNVLDSAPDFAGYKAGVLPGMQVTRINGAPFSIQALEPAVGATSGGASLEFEVATGKQSLRKSLDYRGGLRWPHLVRDAARPDVLEAITTPRTGLR